MLCLAGCKKILTSCLDVTRTDKHSPTDVFEVTSVSRMVEEPFFANIKIDPNAKSTTFQFSSWGSLSASFPHQYINHYIDRNTMLFDTSELVPLVVELLGLVWLF